MQTIQTRNISYNFCSSPLYYSLYIYILLSICATFAFLTWYHELHLSVRVCEEHKTRDSEEEKNPKNRVRENSQKKTFEHDSQKNLQTRKWLPSQG